MENKEILEDNLEELDENSKVSQGQITLKDLNRCLSKIRIAENNPNISFSNLRQFVYAVNNDLVDFNDDWVNCTNFELQVLFPKLGEMLEEVNHIHLKDDLSQDCWSNLYSAFEQTHYDNGLLLTGVNYPANNPTEYNNYFDHYDRDQDFWSWFDDDLVDAVVVEPSGEFGLTLKLTDKQLKRFVKQNYEGSSYDHDFNRDGSEYDDDYDEDEDYDD